MSGNPSRIRSLMKTVTWRILGSGATFTVGYVVSSDLNIAGSIAILQMCVNTALYYAHERIWESSRIENQPEDSPVTKELKHVSAKSTFTAAQVLIRERITELESIRADYRSGVKYWFERARPETPDGVEAYGELNRCKNGLRSCNAKLRKWRAHNELFTEAIGRMAR